METTEAARQNAAIVVESFFATKERHDLEGLTSLFTDDIVYTFPLPASGAQEDWFVYHGKDATVEYQRKTLESFSQLKMRDRIVTVNNDGSTVFVESRGDYVSKEGKSYRNIYVFKFLLKGKKIYKIFEYANPVTYAILAGLPIAGHVVSSSQPTDNS